MRRPLTPLTFCAAVAATVLLGGCAAGTSTPQPPAPASSAPIPPTGTPDTTAPGAARTSAPAVAGPLLGDHLRVAPGTRLVTAVGRTSTEAVRGWYATLLLARATDAESVVSYYSRRLAAGGYVVSADGPFALHATLPAAADPLSPSPSAAPTDAATDPAAAAPAGSAAGLGTYVDVEVVPGDGPVPGYVQIVLTQTR